MAEKSLSASPTACQHTTAERGHDPPTFPLFHPCFVPLSWLGPYFRGYILACIFYSLPETSFYDAAELFTQAFLMRAPLSVSKTFKVKRNLQLNAAHEVQGQFPLEQEKKINLSQNVNSLHHYILDTHSSTQHSLMLPTHQRRLLTDVEEWLLAGRKR